MERRVEDCACCMEPVTLDFGGGCTIEPPPPPVPFRLYYNVADFANASPNQPSCPDGAALTLADFTMPIDYQGYYDDVTLGRVHWWKGCEVLADEGISFQGFAYFYCESNQLKVAPNFSGPLYTIDGAEPWQLSVSGLIQHHYFMGDCPYFSQALCSAEINATLTETAP